jgi:hypothetical protein
VQFHRTKSHPTYFDHNIPPHKSSKRRNLYFSSSLQGPQLNFLGYMNDDARA